MKLTVFILLLIFCLHAKAESHIFELRSSQSFCVDERRKPEVIGEYFNFKISSGDTKSICTVYSNLKVKKTDKKGMRLVALVNSNEPLSPEDTFLAVQSKTFPRTFATPEKLSADKYRFILKVPEHIANKDMKLYFSTNLKTEISLEKFYLEAVDDAYMNDFRQEFRDTFDVVSNNAYRQTNTLTWAEIWNNLNETFVVTNNKSWDVFVAARNTLSHANLYHSFALIKQPNMLAKTVEECNWQPSFQYLDELNVLYIRVDGNHQDKSSECLIQVANAIGLDVAAFITDNDVKKVIADLRFNGGGNMWPMLSVLRSVLNDGRLIGFKYPPHLNKVTEWVTKDYGKLKESDNVILNFKGVQKFNGALEAWVCDRTGSSGEALAIALHSSGAEIVGVPTRGLSTSNKEFPIHENVSIMLTYSKMVASAKSNILSGARIIPNRIVEDKFCSMSFTDALRYTSKR